MFKAHLASYPYVSPVNSYMENLGRAGRSFIAALLAIDPAKVSALPQDRAVEEDPAAISADLERLACEFDSIMPNQAAELRYLACKH